MKKMNSILVVVISSFFLGCAMAPTKFDQFSEGQWTGKARVHDKKQDKTGIVYIKIRAASEEKLRLDVTSTGSDHLMSFLMVGDEAQYLMVKDKQFVKSKATRESFREVMTVPLEPKALYAILFDRPIENKNWSCASEKGLLKSCKDLKGGVFVEWVLREGNNRTIKVSHSAGTVQINLNDFRSAIEAKESAFTLSAPKSFKVIQR